MFWEKKIQTPAQDNLNTIEQCIINYIIKSLPPFCSDLLKQQLLLLNRIRRLEYPNFQVTELFPKSFNSIPSSLLLQRQEEFRLAMVKFSIHNVSYTSEVYCVLGTIFEIKLRPKIKQEISSSDFTLINLNLEENFEKNTIK